MRTFAMRTTLAAIAQLTGATLRKGNRATETERPMSGDPSVATPEPTTSAWSPFQDAAFTILWTVTAISNIGGWISSVASMFEQF